MEAEKDLLVSALPFLIPLLLLELGLLVFALIDVIRRPKVRGGNKTIWILVIVLVNFIGPIIYLAIGRKEDVDDSDKD